MTTAAADDERGHLAPGGRIGTFTLVRGAIRRIMAAWRPLLLLWVVAAVADLGLDKAASAAGLNAAVTGVTLAQVAQLLLKAILAGFTGAFGLRFLLQGPGGWRRTDRGFLECAGLIGLGTILIAAAGVLSTTVSVKGLEDGAAYWSLVTTLTMVVAFYIAVKLTLWPIARLMGRVEVTAGRSWRLMRKATRGYLLAHLLILAPFGVAVGAWGMEVAAAGIAPSLPLWGLALFSFGMQAFGVFSLGVSATAYALRVEAPATVADVFD